MGQEKLRKHLSMDALLLRVKNLFNTIPTPKRCEISTVDCLMSGLAVFGLKSASLLQFAEQLKDQMLAANLKKLYGITQIPCDTQMRERLDVIKPDQIRPLFKQIFAQVQRAKLLESYQFLDGYYLLPIDGTEFFSSNEIHCDYCCTKNHKNGTTSFHHQALGATIVHPNIPYVLPLMPEFICKSDGDTKNDCERNAAKRLLEDVRREHPHLKLIVVEDALYANGPHIKLLESLNMRYIIVAKETDHDYMFKWVKDCELTQHEEIEKGITHKFEFINEVPLNGTHHDLKVNFVRYTQIDKKGGTTTWTWVTNFIITTKNVYQIMQGGRARWHIENNTFNTLKNQGYNFEHNYGHGCKNLSNMMATLMFLAFFMDQIQLLINDLFQAAKAKARTYRILWEKMLHIMDFFSLR